MNPYHQFPYRHGMDQFGRVTHVYANPMYQNISHPYGNHPAYLAQQQQPANHNQQQRNGNQPQFPPVDSNLLFQSANASQKLMAEAGKVLHTLSSSRDFGSQLMDYAQRSNTEEVNHMIKSLGIDSDVKVTYNPDGLRLEFHSKVENVDCCQLDISLRWR